MLAIIALSIVLTLRLSLVNRVIARLWGASQRRGNARSPLLGLSALAVVSHLFLDWLNTYGVRLLMQVGAPNYEASSSKPISAGGAFGK